MTKFWMVFVEGGRNPTYKHASLESAKKEAARLARHCPSCPAYVLEAVESVELPVAWLTLEAPTPE